MCSAMPVSSREAKSRSNEAFLINVYFAISLPVAFIRCFCPNQNHYPTIACQASIIYLDRAQGLCKMESNVLFAKIVPPSLSVLKCNVLLTTIDHGFIITHPIPDVLQSFIMVCKANLIMLQEFWLSGNHKFAEITRSYPGNFCHNNGSCQQSCFCHVCSKLLSGIYCILTKISENLLHL